MCRFADVIVCAWHFVHDGTSIVVDHTIDVAVVILSTFVVVVGRWSGNNFGFVSALMEGPIRLSIQLF